MIQILQDDAMPWWVGGLVGVRGREDLECLQTKTKGEGRIAVYNSKFS